MSPDTWKEKNMIKMLFCPYLQDYFSPTEALQKLNKNSIRDWKIRV